MGISHPRKNPTFRGSGQFQHNKFNQEGEIANTSLDMYVIYAPLLVYYQGTSSIMTHLVPSANPTIGLSANKPEKHMECHQGVYTKYCGSERDIANKHAVQHRAFSSAQVALGIIISLVAPNHGPLLSAAFTFCIFLHARA